MKELPDPESFLPLKPYWLDVLPSPAGRKQHGCGIMQEVPVRTEGKARLWPATLYATPGRLMDEEPTEGPGWWRSARLAFHSLEAVPLKRSWCR
ncbi:MAG: hypothetical protein NT090_05080 [Acidobacteria bacterium]|nr:hypothetical protein [Acidobacteriota bacterium]